MTTRIFETQNKKKIIFFFPPMIKICFENTNDIIIQ